MDQEHVLKLLESLRKALKDTQSNSFFTSNASSYEPIKFLLDPETKPHSVLSETPCLFKLSQLLCNLKTLIEKLEKIQDHGLKSLVRRQITRHKISQVVKAIEAEIRAYFDRVSVVNLVKTLELEESEEEEKVEVLSEFTKRLLKGFDIDFQDLVLKAKVFSILEKLLCDSNCSKRVREHVALATDALASFNRNVFVGLVLMGPTIQALVSMCSSSSIRVLFSLINLVRSPLVDEIHSRGLIPKVIELLGSADLSVQVAALDCVCEIAYIGRSEVIEAMLQEGLIGKLMELQRSEHGDNLIKRDQRINGDSDSDGEVICDCVEAGNGPFANCVARFAVQVEVGEGLTSTEKEEVKLGILRRVREASVSEAESGTVVAAVLWGSSP